MNECWQEEPVFFFLGRLMTCMSKGGDRGKKGLEEGGEKALRGKQLLKRSNTGEGDTLTSCMRCHGYQSPVCPPFLAFLPPPSFPQHIGSSRGKGTTETGGEKETMKGEEGTEQKEK